MNDSLQSTDILGTKVTASSEREILDFITTGLQKNNFKCFITTPNPEIVTFAQNHNSYRDILNQAQIALPDGVGLLMASHILGKSLKRRITGVDFMEKLCREYAESGVSWGFLGGKKGVAEKVAKCLVQKYPEINISFIGQEWSKDGFVRAKELRIKNSFGNAQDRQELGEEKISKDKKNHNSSFMIHDSNSVDFLFVAYGFPKQEKWIAENLPKIQVKVAMGVGGAFDFLSGDVSRAPGIFRSLGVEWLYRLIRQPWRWKRQLALVKFLILVVKERLIPRVY